MPLFRTALSLCVALSAAACTPEEDPNPYVREDTPIETDRGYFTLDLRAAEGRSWPEHVGSTTIAVRIKPGDPERVEDLELRPPLVLRVEASEWLPAKAWPLTPDGFTWMVALDFARAGDWTVPVTIHDARGTGDEAALVFHIEDARRRRRAR